MKNFNQTLDAIKTQKRYRYLNLPHGIDLSSNDYLGISQHIELRKAAIVALENGLHIGATGSRLLRGHTQSHQNLEDFASQHFLAPRTLYFSSGFLANYAIFTTLPERHDIILYDSLIHASVRDGVQSSIAKGFKFEHNDLDSLERQLKIHTGKKIWIAIESVYSMDGDLAPLNQIHNLAQKYGAMLIVDEAHATGIFGDQGKGLCWPIINKHAYNNLITLHTCGKAIGVAGGLICAENEIIEILINRARAFIYSTAPMPLQAYLVQKSLEIIASAEGDKLREKLLILCGLSQKIFGGYGTQIIPIVLKYDEKAVRIAQILQKKGYDIRAIRPPTVPDGTARLRLSLNSNLEVQILQNFADALKMSLEEVNL